MTSLLAMESAICTNADLLLIGRPNHRCELVAQAQCTRLVSRLRIAQPPRRPPLELQDIPHAYIELAHRRDGQVRCLLLHFGMSHWCEWTGLPRVRTMRVQAPNST